MSQRFILWSAEAAEQTAYYCVDAPQQITTNRFESTVFDDRREATQIKLNLRRGTRERWFIAVLNLPD